MALHPIVEKDEVFIARVGLAGIRNSIPAPIETVSSSDQFDRARIDARRWSICIMVCWLGSSPSRQDYRASAIGESHPRSPAENS